MKSERPWYRRWWALTVIAVVAIGIIGAIIQKKSSTKKATTTTTSSTTTTTATTVTTVTTVTTASVATIATVSAPSAGGVTTVGNDNKPAVLNSTIVLPSTIQAGLLLAITPIKASIVRPTDYLALGMSPKQAYHLVGVYTDVANPFQSGANRFHDEVILDPSLIGSDGKEYGAVAPVGAPIPSISIKPLDEHFETFYFELPNAVRANYFEWTMDAGTSAAGRWTLPGTF
jgi:hypothetical protein